MISNTLNQQSKKVVWGLPSKTPSQFSTGSTAMSTPQYSGQPGKITPTPGLLQSPQQNLSQYKTGGAPTYNQSLYTPPTAPPSTNTGTTNNYRAPNQTQPSNQQQIQEKLSQVAQLQSQIPAAREADKRAATEAKAAAKAEEERMKNSFPGLVKRVAGAGTANKTQTGLLSNLQQTAEGNQAIGQQAQDIANKYAPEINRIGQLGAGAVAGNLSTGSNVVGSGNANLAAQSVSSRIQALQNAQNSELAGVEKQLTAQGQTANAYNQALTGANTQQGQQISALGTAAGYTQPVQVPYSNQYIDPTTGQAIGGQGGGSLQSAVQSIAQQVQNGTMSYDQGVQALSGYGQGGMNALQQALGGGFSPLQSNATAAANQAATLQTGTIGGELTKQADTVVQHMLTLKNTYKELSAQFGIPAINQAFNYVGGKLGSGPLQSYKIALTNVRDELAKILGGGTSTEGTRATAESLLPNNMTPAQIDAAITTATELMNSKIQEYTRAPQYGNQQQSNNQMGIVQTSAGAINTDW